MYYSNIIILITRVSYKKERDNILRWTISMAKVGTGNAINFRMFDLKMKNKIISHLARIVFRKLFCEHAHVCQHSTLYGYGLTVLKLQQHSENLNV